MSSTSLKTGNKKAFILKSVLLLILAALILADCASAPIKSSLLAVSEDELPRSHFRPQWYAKLNAEEADIFRFVQGGKMLVGTLDLGGSYFWAPYDHDLALFDLETGKRLWTIDRKNYAIQYTQVLIVDPVILVKGGTRYGAISVDDGSLLWRYQPNGLPMEYVTAHEGIIIFKRPSEEAGSIEFQALETKTGKNVWTVELEGMSGGKKQPGLSVWDERIFLYGEKIALLDSKDGSVVWKKDNPVGAPVTFSLSDEYMAISGPHGLALLKTSDGSMAWKIRGGTGSKLMSLQGHAVVMASPEGKRGSWKLEAYNRKGRAWGVKLNSSISSTISFGSARIYFTSGGFLYCVSKSSGKVVFKAGLPEFMTNTKSLPPGIRIMANKVVVAGEHGVAAYSTKTGKLLFKHWVEGADLFTHAYALNRMAIKNIPNGAGYAEVHIPTQNYNTASYNYTSTMQSYSNYVDQNTEAVLRSPHSTYSERMAALDYNIATKQAAHAYGMAQASVQAAQAQIVAMISLVQTGIAWRSGHIGQRNRLHSLMVEKAYETLNDALQFGYYLRPWFRDGWGITVVDLASGKRADILHTAYNEPLLVGSAQLPVIAIDPLNERLLVKGLGLDRSKHVMYKKNALSFEIPFFPYRWEIPYPSILAYDLKSIRFTSEGSGRFVKRPGMNEKDRMLVEAILAKDEEKMQVALDAGAEVNAQDEYGNTPAFYGALTNDKAVNKLLVKYGADTIACDIGGQTPSTWAIYAIPVAKGVYHIIKLNNDRIEEDYGEIEPEKRHRACMKEWGHLK